MKSWDKVSNDFPQAYTNNNERAASAGRSLPWTWQWDYMRWKPNAANNNDDGGDSNSCSPLHLLDEVFVVCNNVYSVDNNLHQTLDLAYPVDEYRKQNSEMS